MASGDRRLHSNPKQMVVTGLALFELDELDTGATDVQPNYAFRP